MKRHVVKPHQPLRLLLLVFLAGSVIAAGVWLLAEYSHWQLIREQMAENYDQKRLWRSNQELEEENARLRRRLAMLQTNDNIDQQATAELQDQLVALQNKVYKLTRELEFYRGIVSSTGDVSGLAIQALQFEPTRQADQYRFKLVLTYVAKSDRVISGNADVALEGAIDGTPQTLSLTELMREQSVSFDYSFKHFKRFEGTVDLPSAFKPRRLRVQLLPKNSSHTRIERVFEWPEVTG